MKMILFALLISSLGFAAQTSGSSNSVPQCYRNSGVDTESPYLLVLYDYDKSSASKVVSALRASPVVKVDRVEGHLFTIISLSPKMSGSQTSVVDVAVADTVRKIVQKYAPWNSEYSFGCNDISVPNPKAGGMNSH